MTDSSGASELVGTVQLLELRTKHAFIISRGGADTFKNLVVKIVDDKGHVGYGEGAPRAYYKETAEGCIEWVQNRLKSPLPKSWKDWAEEVDSLSPNAPHSAVCALDVALHDLWAQRENLPLYQFVQKHYGLVPVHTATDLPKSSFTIGLDSIEVVKEKAIEAREEGYPIFKVKLGGKIDMEMMKTIRDVAPNVILTVDANNGWTVDETMAKSETLVGLGVEFIEQPLPRDNDVAGYEELKKRKCPLPIYCDESCVLPSDVGRLLGRVDGLNIKLTKCCGIYNACKMIKEIRAFGDLTDSAKKVRVNGSSAKNNSASMKEVKVMLGCMIESSVGISAVAHLAMFVDVLDLDGAALLLSDPFAGASMIKGIVTLRKGNGLGVSPLDAKYK